MKWFKHDSDANADSKLIKLRMKYGLEGYGLYWYCLELIANSVDENNITFELEHDSEVIGFNTGIHFEKIQEMMSYMIKLNLFENNSSAITCFKMALRLDQSMTSNPKMRKLIANLRQNHDSVMTKSCKIRLDKIRLDKNRKQSRFAPPTLQEIKTYCQDRNNNIDPEKFFYFYESKNWMIGKNKMKSWKSAIATWERSDNRQTNDSPYALGAL